MGVSLLSLKKHFGTLPDPRLRRRRLHELLDIIAIAICAVIGNADTWPDIVTFGKSHRAWFKRFLPLSNGIPSHDTFERVFDLLDPQAFGRCFLNWTDSLFANLGLKQIAIDGKTLRGSRKDGLGALHLVSAWVSKNHLSLGQVAVNEKSNEITAIPKLLEMLQRQLDRNSERGISSKQARLVNSAAGLRRRQRGKPTDKPTELSLGRFVAKQQGQHTCGRLPIIQTLRLG